MVKITFEGMVTRIYDETRGQRTNHYVVVSDDGGKYANILRFTLKPNVTLNCGEGDKVRVSAYIDGREWANNEGKLMYFTDLKIDTVDVLASAQGYSSVSVPAAAQTVTANDWKSLLALGAANGEDEAAVTARCKAYQAKVNRRFTPEDYSAIAKEIVSAHTPTTTPPASAFSDEMPF